MVVSIALGLGVGSPSRGLALEPPVVPLAFSATPAAFARDTLIFDSGAAGGANAVTIPLPDIATDAPDGATIEARAVHADTWAPAYGWRAVGTATGGAVRGAILVEPGNARRPHWLRIETRVQGSAATPRQTPNRFGVGHVLAIWGQSEIANLVSPFYEGAVTPAPITADDMVSVHWHARSPMGSGAAGVVHHLVSAADPYNARLAAMANSLIAASPGEKFAVILQAQSGTGFNQLVGDGVPGRAWLDDLALHAAATGGGDVGLVVFDWYAAPRTYGSAYGQVLHQIAFGKTIAGADIGATPVSIDGRFVADHLLTELYDWNVSSFTVLEPHRFEPGNDANIAATRDAVRAMYAASTVPALVGPAHPVLHYRNGRSDGAGGWTDVAHPSPGEGSVRFGVGLVQSAVRAMGLTGWTPPVIDNAHWAPDGTHVDLWSSAGPIIAGAGYPVGVVVDGAAVDAVITDDGGPAGDVAGVLRVTAPVGSPFTGTTVVDFAPVSTGLTDVSQSETGWDRYPRVDVGAPGMPDGVPLANKPDPAHLASTLQGAPLFAVNGDTRYQAPNHAPDTPYTILVRMNPSVSSGQLIFSQDQVIVQFLSDGGLRYNAPGISNQDIGAAFNMNAMNDFMLTLDPATGTVGMYVNGTAINTHTVPPWTWATNRQWRILGNITNTTGHVERVTLWHAHTPTGTPPTGTPAKIIEGDEAGVIATASAAPRWLVVRGGTVINP